mgnify:CR=1 FL=1|tara:strand:+ start:325 stop:879 length:555 start_codon:yes stop_codon:yes gene_type:complete
MTRNSRKKASLSIKKYPSKKTQQGGGHGSSTAAAMLVPNGRVLQSDALTAQQVAQQIAYANKLSTVNIKHMLKDVTSGGGEFSRLLTNQHDLRTKYISELNASNASILKIKEIVNTISSKYHKYHQLINRYKRNGYPGKTTPSMYSDVVITELNKLRIQLLLDLNNILTTEIEELRDLCSNYYG